MCLGKSVQNYTIQELDIPNYEPGDANYNIINTGGR